MITICMKESIDNGIVLLYNNSGVFFHNRDIVLLYNNGIVLLYNNAILLSVGLDLESIGAQAEDIFGGRYKERFSIR